MIDLSRLHSACLAERSVLTDPAASEHDIDRATALVQEMSAEVWDSPVATFDDVLARALIAHQHADRDPHTGRLVDLDPSAPAADRATAELISAVLRLAECFGHAT